LPYVLAFGSLQKYRCTFIRSWRIRVRIPPSAYPQLKVVIHQADVLLVTDAFESKPLNEATLVNLIYRAGDLRFNLTLKTGTGWGLVGLYSIGKDEA